MYKFINFPWDKLIDGKQVFVQGGRGKGKTLLCSALSHQLFHAGHVAGVTANIPLVWSMPYDFWDWNPPRLHWCFLYDEIGKLFDNRNFKDKKRSKQATDSVVNLRKKGTYLLCPSVMPPDKRFRDTAIRIWRIAKAPFLWSYYWETGMEQTGNAMRRPDLDYECGRFFLFHPSWFYGCYDTFDIPQENRLLAFLDLMTLGAN